MIMTMITRVTDFEDSPISEKLRTSFTDEVSLVTNPAIGTDKVSN